MDQKKVTDIEREMLEEHRKDLKALARLKRFLHSSESTSAPQTSNAIPVQPSEPIAPLVPEEGTPLKHAIRDIMNNDPNRKWSNGKMLNYLSSIGFNLKAKKPIYSIGQATQQLVESGEVKLQKQGFGSLPNIYRGLTQLEKSALESAEELEAD